VEVFTSPPTGICIHHSLTEDGPVLDRTAIRKYHKDFNGWDDEGYHGYVERVEDEIRIVSGRNLIYQGAHSPALNRTHLGLCLVGNFDEQAPSQEIFDAAVRTCLGWMKMFPSIKRENITFHNMHSNKSCPGKMFPRTAFLLEIEKRKS
jgi:hypothetical protein